MSIALKRVYKKSAPADGNRVPVDRMRPRGVSKEAAELDEWIKEAAPSDQLHKWFHSDRSRWGEFRKRYLSELKGHRHELRRPAERARSGRVTLVFSA